MSLQQFCQWSVIAITPEKPEAEEALLCEWLRSYLESGRRRYRRGRVVGSVVFLVAIAAAWALSCLSPPLVRAEEVPGRTFDQAPPELPVDPAGLLDKIATALLTPETATCLVDVSIAKGFGGQFAVFSEPGAGFPTDPGSYVVLSSGNAPSVLPNTAATFSSIGYGSFEGLIPEEDGGSPTGHTTNDRATLQVTLEIPPDATTLHFDWKFGSEEPPSYYQSIFQDYFSVVLDDGSSKTVEVQTWVDDNIDTLGANLPSGLSIFPLPPLPVPNNTLYNSVTPNIQTATIDVTAFRGSVITLNFHVADATDIAYDSGVFLDNLGGFQCDVDEFLCYEASPAPDSAPFEPVRVELQDQFGQETTTLLRPKTFCAPVDKNGEGIGDPSAHLTCYELFRGEPPFSPRDVQVEDQFGSQTVTLLASETLCVPSVKNLEPTALSLDHFKCYQATKERPPFTPRDVVLVDQFGQTPITAWRPRNVCTPVDKNDEGILDRQLHLTCYDLFRERDPKFARREVLVENQFGEATLSLLKPTALCTPSVRVEPLCGGAVCQSDEVCDRTDPTCSIDNPPGSKCVSRPEICALFFDPVCGCDGVTYGNDCERLRAGATLAHSGACGP